MTVLAFPPRTLRKAKAAAYVGVPVPAFELLLARNGAVHVAKQFVADETMDGIAVGEPFDCSAAVLPEPHAKITGHADVNGAVRLAGEDIDAGLALERHGSEIAAPWMLKQVQHDGIYD